MHDEVDAYGWPVAGRRAFPLAISFMNGAMGDIANPVELTVLEALARGLTRSLQEPGALHDAWAGRAPYSQVSAVQTSAGAVAVAIEVLPDTPID